MLRRFLESIGRRYSRSRVAQIERSDPAMAARLAWRMTPLPPTRSAVLSGKERGRWSTNQLSS